MPNEIVTAAELENLFRAASTGPQPLPDRRFDFHGLRCFGIWETDCEVCGAAFTTAKVLAATPTPFETRCEKHREKLKAAPVRRGPKIVAEDGPRVRSLLAKQRRVTTALRAARIRQAERAASQAEKAARRVARQARKAARSEAEAAKIKADAVAAIQRAETRQRLRRLLGLEGSPQE